MSDKSEKQPTPAAEPTVPETEQKPSKPKSGKQPRQRMALDDLERMGLDPGPYGLAASKKGK